MQPPQAALPTLSSGFRSTEQPAKWYLEAPDYFYAAIRILGQAWPGSSSPRNPTAGGDSRTAGTWPCPRLS